MGDGANPAGVIGAIVVEFDSGEPLRLVTDSSWKSTDQKQENWQKADLDDSAWQPAHLFAAYGARPGAKLPSTSWGNYCPPAWCATNSP